MAGEITTEFQSWDERADECLVLSVTMTFTFRMTGWSEANKYNVYSNKNETKGQLSTYFVHQRSGPSLQLCCSEVVTVVRCSSPRTLH